MYRTCKTAPRWKNNRYSKSTACTHIVLKRQTNFVRQQIDCSRRTFCAQNTTHRPIKNKNTVFQEISLALGKNKEPSIEYIYVSPAWTLVALRSMFKSHLAVNPYGHSAIRYTLPSGESKVMNIVGVPGSEMVFFLKPEDYLFGLPNETSNMGSEQGGIFQRSFISLRIEEISADQVVKIDKFYKSLKQRSSLDITEKEGVKTYGDAKYHMLFGPLYNVVRRFFPRVSERGNCAYWTSKGLVEAGILKRPSMFPKLLFLKTLAACATQFPLSNINVVVYQCVDKHKPVDGGWVSPFHYLRQRMWHNIHGLADVKVSVKDDLAVVKVKPTSRYTKVWDYWYDWSVNMKQKMSTTAASVSTALTDTVNTVQHWSQSLTHAMSSGTPGGHTVYVVCVYQDHSRNSSTKILRAYSTKESAMEFARLLSGDLVENTSEHSGRYAKDDETNENDKPNHHTLMTPEYDAKVRLAKQFFPLYGIPPDLWYARVAVVKADFFVTTTKEQLQQKPQTSQQQSQPPHQ